MDTWNTIINIATPIIITGVAGMLVKLIYSVGEVIIDYAKVKKEESGLNKQLVQHKDEINKAKEVWNIIEEKYRITEKVEDLLVSKADMFDDLLLKKIPYLTKENLDDLRFAIAGEFNKGKQAVITDESLKQSQIELTNANTQLTDTNTTLQATNDKLASDNALLQARLDYINSALNPIVQTVVDNAVQSTVDTNNTVINEVVVDNAKNQATV